MPVTGTRIEVHNAKELRRLIRKANSNGLKKALRLAYKTSAGVVATRAQSLAPHLSGDLRDSIRPLATQTKGRVAAGKYASREYAGVIHYGWPGHNIEPQEFLHEALSDEWPKVIDAFETELDRLAEALSATR